MVSLDFVLPHWAYWVGLILFPVLAMVMARRARPETPTYSAPLGYLILFSGGILGLHRFYLKSRWGFLFLPIFAFVLYANATERDAREALSNANNTVRVSERIIDREEPRVSSARAEIEQLRAEAATAEEGSFAQRSAQRRAERAEARITNGEQQIEQARRELEASRPVAATAAEKRAFWGSAARYAFFLILVLVAIDAVLLPRLVAAARMRDEAAPPSSSELAVEEIEAEEARDDASHVSDGWTGWIDRMSLYAGEFVSYWAVIAVFVYYYEVIARYVFNSPTSWAHEGMYLMFGMQYLIAGAYAMLTESHVRVDVFYAPLSPRGKSVVNLFTSIFFFIFAGTLLLTSYVFAIDSIGVPAGNAGLSDWVRGETGFGDALVRLLTDAVDPAIRFGEISFNEWEIPLWPMKFMMVAGALLLLLQGISKIAQDIRAIVRGA